jgi:hypothetical protein
MDREKRHGVASPGGEWAFMRATRSLLMRRTFDVDGMACVRCGGRLKVRAVVTAAASTARILESLARPMAPPQAA